MNSLADLKERLPSLSNIIYFDPDQYFREKTSDPLQLKQTITEAEKCLGQLKEEMSGYKECVFFCMGI